MSARGALWRVRWRVANETGVELRLTGLAIPHGRFRAADQDLDIALRANGTAELAADVSFTESRGTEVENAFLILTARSDGRDWRILARLRVPAGEDGAPRPLTERIDVQEVGFNGPG
ncbi:MAG TPA: hypothetical protein VHG53_07655 [Candidatus Limnocylindria bacterium]|nr:hypothetical protein [Candidatus Limnocylindria bacterium]